MNVKKKYRLGWCSRILIVAALLCFIVQLAIVPGAPNSIITGVPVGHRQRRPTPPGATTSNRRLLYVHIGKTGGEWIKSQLAIICKTRKNPKLRQTCLDSFPTEATSTELSRQTGGYLHVHNLFPRNAIAWASHYLFSIRHPLQRLVSWYVYNHPQSCDPRESNSPSCKSSDWKTKFFDCFPTLEVLGGGQISKEKDDDCAQVLWNGWYGRLSNVKDPNHLYWNYQFYWNQTMAHWPKPLLVVRQEHLTMDLNHLESYLGTKSTPRPWRPSDAQHFVTGRVPSTLTIKATQNLCCLLQTEMEIYQRLIQLAENLSDTDKMETIDQAYQLCGVRNHDWNELHCEPK